MDCELLKGMGVSGSSIVSGSESHNISMDNFLPKGVLTLGSLLPPNALTINIILNYLDLIYWESILNLKN